MDAKSPTTRQVTRKQAETIAAAWATPDNLAWLDALSDEDIAAQIESNPDAAPELTDAWFDRALGVTETDPPTPKSPRP